MLLPTCTTASRLICRTSLVVHTAFVTVHMCLLPRNYPPEAIGWTLASIHSEAQSQIVVLAMLQQLSYENWHDGNPNYDKKWPHCVIVWKEGEWYDKGCCDDISHCYYRAQALCSRTTVCEGTMCYKAAPTSRLYTHQEAKDYCEALRRLPQITKEAGPGGFFITQDWTYPKGGAWVLASMDNPDHNSVVNGLVTGSKWIGLSDRNTEGTFVWDDPETDLRFTNWEGHTPDFRNDRGDCVLMLKNGDWKVVECGPTGDPLVPKTAAAVVCSSRRFDAECEGNMCFFGSPPSCDFKKKECVGVPETGFYYPGAKLYCEAIGWTLASIHSEAQNQIVRSLSHRWKWIGLRDEDEEGTFVWGDRTQLSYENWRDGYPRYYKWLPAGQHCVLASGGGEWSNDDCGKSPFFYRAQAVCSRTIVPNKCMLRTDGCEEECHYAAWGVTYCSCSTNGAVLAQDGTTCIDRYMLGNTGKEEGQHGVTTTAKVVVGGAVVGTAMVVALVGYSIQARRMRRQGVPAGVVQHIMQDGVGGREMVMVGLSATQQQQHDEDDPTERWTTNPMRAAGSGDP